jgi:hypothetical protein
MSLFRENLRLLPEQSPEYGVKRVANNDSPQEEFLDMAGATLPLFQDARRSCHLISNNESSPSLREVIQ